MKVLLAGFNVEAETLEKAQEHLDDELTPEVISAAYARISRDPRNVNTLRREARRQVEKARRSNESIVFGLGHSSVAEHAVFNFDVMDISRLAVESIQSFRLASFTEKSQRYIRLGRDYVLPEEIGKSQWEDEFREIVDVLSDAYGEVYTRIVDSGEDKGVAKEDARYLMPLATSAQFGMTINAREAEYMISRLASHRLAELRAFSGKLADIAAKRAPSLVKYPHPTPYFMTVGDKRVRIAEDAGCITVKVHVSDGSLLSLVSATEDGDRRLAAALIFSSTSCSFEEAERKAAGMKVSRIGELIRSTFGEMRPHDSAWREFECIEMLFEAVVSASCYAQLKRHRMSTQIVQRYDPSLGCSIPGSVVRSGSITLFRKALGKAQKLYRKIASEDTAVAEYTLTNAHRRRVLIGINLRELYHFSRLRSDAHAQWEIRELSGAMCDIARNKFPSATSLLGGKDGFDEAYRDLHT